MQLRLVGAIFSFIILLQFGCSSSRSGLDTSPETFRCFYDGRIQQIGSPLVVAEFVQFQGSDKTRVDVYLEIPHTQLHFTTDGGEQLATEYHINITVNDQRNNIIDRKDLTRKISTTRGQVTRYGASDRTMQSFKLDPGEYRFVITIHDRAVNTRTQFREVVQVRPINPEPVAMSDLLLIRSIRQENDRRIINPMLSDRILALTEPFHVFTELYSEFDDQEVTLRYGLVRNYYNNDFVIDNPFSYRVQRPYHRTGIRIEDHDTVITRDTTLTLRAGTNQLFLPFDQVERGSYVMFVKNVVSASAASNQQLSAQSEFMVHSIDFPYMTDVDQQIEALYYIASTRELNNLKSGETLEDRRKRLNEYWQNIGGWKMSDYYERVRLANELFTSNVEGWKTPMGMVYIILGEPHIVECRIGIERMEIWTYYLQSGGMEFIFIRERTADPDERQPYYWISSIRGGYSTWLTALNMWR